jgi:type I restriction enzyme M protein
MRANLTGKTPNPNKPEARRGRVLFVNADAEYLAGRAQNHLRPEDIEKIASTFERYGEVENYSKIVAFDEIADSANDFNLNVRRYVDNSPPPEPHDVRAHLTGGIPVAEIEANGALFEALGFSPDVLFAHRPDDDRYRDFKPGIAERPAVSRLIEADAGLLARTRSLRDALSAWWETHTGSLIALPQGRNSNAVRSEFLQGFAEALLPLGCLGNFKLSGVVAAWWTETLPDFKTLMENGFCGVVDGWIDAIADAVEDDDNVGPALDPFSHKLVKRTMAETVLAENRERLSSRLHDASKELGYAC